jgi:hypothetical protein
MQAGPVPWFVKTETFRLPYSAMRPHLMAHRAWVEQLRLRGVMVSSGYLGLPEKGRSRTANAQPGHQAS